MIGNIYQTLVTKPLINLIQFLYNLTGDIGISVFLVAIIINLLLWPLFWQSYLNGQKMRWLQPQFKKIQDKHKDDVRTMMMERAKLSKEHNVRTSSTFLTLLIQLPIIFGLFRIIRGISNNQGGTLCEESGWCLYNFVSSNPAPELGDLALNYFDISRTPLSYGAIGMIIPVTVAIFSFLNSSFIFKWGPQLPKPTPEKKKKKKDAKGDEMPDMMEGIGNALKWQMMYFLPVFLLFINMGFAMGLNFYFLGGVGIGFLRQMFISNHLNKNYDKLIGGIINSDPKLKKDYEKQRAQTVSYNVNKKTDPAILEDEPVASALITKRGDKKAAKKTSKKTAAKKKTYKKSTKAKKENLTKVEGIGPAINKALNAAGINTFAELSNASQDAIKDAIKDVRGKHVSKSWPKQAKLAEEDKWDELKSYQDTLNRGE